MRRGWIAHWEKSLLLAELFPPARLSRDFPSSQEQCHQTEEERLLLLLKEVWLRSGILVILIHLGLSKCSHSSHQLSTLTTNNLALIFFVIPSFSANDAMEM